VDQRLADPLAFEVALQVRARLAAFRPDADGLADPEPLTDEVVQRDPLGRQVPPVDAGREVDAVVRLDGVECLPLDEGEVAPRAAGGLAVLRTLRVLMSRRIEDSPTIENLRFSRGCTRASLS
jgi:hypothetical protein